MAMSSFKPKRKLPTATALEDLARAKVSLELAHHGLLPGRDGTQRKVGLVIGLVDDIIEELKASSRPS